ncbi:hypothetical protein BD414DRAFT_491945 [Trametes punicea]|nr:hypothetical protein BD414DRAFT_491945 [Trametes punicea]
MTTEEAEEHPSPIPKTQDASIGSYPSIDRNYPHSPPTSPATKNRFIVEPQVLNAAFEWESGARREYSSSLPHSGGGLPPPPRPNSRKSKLSGSTPSSPATSTDHSIASLPNSPTSSPYSNYSPNTPGSSDVSPHVKPSPRLSNFLRGESLMFSMRRRSLAEQHDSLYDQKEEEEEMQTAVTPWSPRDMPVGEGISPLDSVPASPELLASPASADGSSSRPLRQNRYLTGLQKIKKLGRTTQGALSMFADASVRGGRRMSDADVDSQRSRQPGQASQAGSVDFSVSSMSARYRRIRAKDVGPEGKTAGAVVDLIKQPSSVPSSPIVPLAETNSSASNQSNSGTTASPPPQEQRRGSIFRKPSIGVPVVRSQSASMSGTRTTATATATGESDASASAGRASLDWPQPPPRARVSHARQTSDLSTSSATHSSLNFSPASSDSSHDPPPSTVTDARISISSTIYSTSPTSSNNHSFDIARCPDTITSTSTTVIHPGRASMSADRESFIDLASPTFSPLSLEFQDISIPQQQSSQSPHTEQQPTPATSSHDNNEFNHGQSPIRSVKPRLPPIVPPTGSAKPPIPTTPKPDFSRRSRSGHSSAAKPDSKASSTHHAKHGGPLSTFASDLDRGLSTTNTLTPRERAQRVRTTHKLTQVFGQTPGVSPVSPADSRDSVHFANGCMPMPGNLTLNLSAKRKYHHRPAVSMSDEVITPVYGTSGELIWPPPEGTRYVSLASRRHSAPLSPEELSFMVGRRSSDSNASSALGGGAHDGSPVIEIGTVEGVPDGDAQSIATSRTSQSGRWTPGTGPGSPTSFMDLSDEEGVDDGISEVFAETPRAGRAARRDEFGLLAGGLSDSLSLSSEQLAEEERRRKREKLAKLHRFLGSRVPPHLVLGPLDEGTPLPPPAPSPSPFERPYTDDSDVHRPKMRRRRSSSAAEFSRTWSDDIDRLKEELNEREKAINVRRAVKMEKVRRLEMSHRSCRNQDPSILSTNAKVPPSPKSSPRSPSSPAFRFTQSGPSSSKSKKKNGRPGTSDSAKPLMGDSSEPGLLDPTRSSVYMHYRHSLNSLNDIIDRDDRESLAELHDYLSGHQLEHHFPGPVSPSAADDLSFVATPTIKSERRRSLPSRTSIASFTSELSFVVAPTPTEPSFQQRRRRAAKLTHFFGVDYRELMNEILDSIEKGLEEERGKGTLRPDEVKDLQQKLVSLKTKRNSLRR